MKEMLKKNTKICLIYFLVFIILISSYMVLMTITSLIPSSAIEDNVRKSSETLLEDGEKILYHLGYKKEIIFTFTDALMINTAYSIDSRYPMGSSLLARKNYIPNQTKIIYPDSQYDLGANVKYKNLKNGDVYQTKELYGLMHGDNIEDSYEYARYWHGYLVFLRPLLVLFDYSMIRVILAIIGIISITTLIVLICKKINWINAIIFLLGLFSICIWLVTKSINEFLIFLVAFISSIILLLRYKKIKHIGLFFFVIGSVSSFIDLLTAPIVTLGLTTIIYFLLLQKEESLTIKESTKKILSIGVSWCLGYGLTWGAKWIIVELLFENKPMMSQVFTQIAYRRKLPNNAGGKAIGIWNVFENNFKFLSRPILYTIGIGAFIFMIGFMFTRYKKKINFKENLKKCIPYVATFLFPIVWLIVIAQHSYIHAFFVYRILIISIVSLFTIILKLFDIEQTNDRKQRERGKDERNNKEIQGTI